MTTIYHSNKQTSLKKEISQIKKSAHKFSTSKDSAKKFLVSTGVYTANGKLAARFR